MKKIILLIIALHSLQLSAQTNEEAAIKQVIAGLFSSMQKFDTLNARLLFHADARLQTALLNSKTFKTRLVTESVDSFLYQIGKLKNDTLKIEERIIKYGISIDGPMASVWAPYEFYINGKLSHTGVDAFQLFKSQDGWKIIQICDTRKKVNR